MPRENQSLHDWLIGALVKTNGFTKYAGDNNYVVATNMSDEKNVALGTGEDKVWPDIVVYDPSTKNASKLGDTKRIAEVETEETVTIDHGKGQWDVYASKVSDFILAVPKSSVKDTKQILDELDVKCKLWSSEVQTDDDGNPASANFSIET